MDESKLPAVIASAVAAYLEAEKEAAGQAETEEE
jgi:hypothetical protein